MKKTILWLVLGGVAAVAAAAVAGWYWLIVEPSGKSRRSDDEISTLLGVVYGGEKDL